MPDSVVVVVEPCPECGGLGVVVLFTSVQECPRCRGKGKVETAVKWPDGNWVIKGGG